MIKGVIRSFYRFSLTASHGWSGTHIWVRHFVTPVGKHMQLTRYTAVGVTKHLLPRDLHIEKAHKKIQESWSITNTSFIRCKIDQHDFWNKSRWKIICSINWWEKSSLWMPIRIITSLRYLPRQRLPSRGHLDSESNFKQLQNVRKFADQFMTNIMDWLLMRHLTYLRLNNFAFVCELWMLTWHQMKWSLDSML